MGHLPGSVARKGWVVALVAAAGLGLTAEDAFAQRHQGGQRQQSFSGQSQSSISGRGQHSSSGRGQHSFSGQGHHSWSGQGQGSSWGERRHSSMGEPRHFDHSWRSGSGWRHHHRHFWGPPARVVVVPSFVPGPLYYAPAPVVVAPPVVPSTSSGYWYFCPDSRTYYPYVLECPSGWLAVVPGAAGP